MMEEETKLLVISGILLALAIFVFFNPTINNFILLVILCLIIAGICTRL
jgi:uncharacterized membrane protein HdeD (DUF308 family)